MNRFFVFCLLCLPFLSKGGPIPIQQKALIVQFSESRPMHELRELSGYKFKGIQPLNVEMTLFVFRYEIKTIAEYQAIEMVRNLPFYTLHQEDTEIQLRSTFPNDSLFYRQWHLPLIRATEAWDLTRKGVNGNGDTLVIAVIDDGLHINHPDFQGNIWMNRADTAGNGLDDDGNGYTDDHYGWNFMGGNNDISDSDYYKAGHGTPVAGIIGARGNNITGITGIMWNIKLMIVSFTDTGTFPAVFQSDVLKAYHYVLHQRKLYNSSNGTKGAYVVASNASWGVDGKFPHQAPLWCSMYDSLGKYGILNISAVSNDPQNQVDTYGDLPTLCSSKHLITVGSSTSSDNYFSSGYSSISVDLSAPGASIYSTAAYTEDNINMNRIYRSGFSGTSFAAPMVTAAVGILHAFACERVLDSIRLNPAKGNEMIRSFILEGVDQVGDLAGKTVTGGRLNIKKSMELMNQFCFGYSGIDDWKREGILLYPNPGSGIIEIVSPSPVTEISCFEPSGKRINCQLQGQILDISGLVPGVYWIQINTADASVVIKYLLSN